MLLIRTWDWKFEGIFHGRDQSDGSECHKHNERLSFYPSHAIYCNHLFCWHTLLCGFFFLSRNFPSLSCLSFISLIDHTAIFLFFPSNEEKKAHWKKIIECAFILMRWEFSSFFLVCDCFDVKRFWSGMSREIRKLIHAINLNGHQIWQSFFTLPSNKFCLLLWKLTRESFKHFFRSLVFYAS